jgi:hypothetical protein
MPPPARPKDDDASLVDQMAEDAVEVPTEYPPGVPELKTMLAIQPRSRRAAFKRKYAEVAEYMSTVRELEKNTKKIKSDDERQVAELRLWAEVDELYQRIIDALRIAAVDEAKFDAWADEVSDEDLQATFAVYQQRTQPGEAPSSTS